MEMLQAQGFTPRAIVRLAACSKYMWESDAELNANLHGAEL